MKPIALVTLILLLGGALLGTVIASRAPQGPPDLAPLKNLPSGAVELVEAQPFVLEQPYVHEWRAEKPLVHAGYVLVLKVPRELARPRDTYEAVLYVGEQTAERCNTPEDGEFLIVVVPAPVDASGKVELDPESVPIWFGGLELPERVDAARVASELRSARAHGIGPAPKASGARLRSAASSTIRLERREDLDPYIADWIERYSPAEVDLIAQLRRS